MKKEPLVSVIIPTYNRALLIGETLDSVLAQTYQNWECIIVDDGSSDNTDKVVSEYVQKDSRFIIIYRPEKKLKGASPCRNFGFTNSKGDYVIFLDSDDWLLPHCLMDRVSFMKKKPTSDFLVTPMSIRRKDSSIIKKDIPVCNDYLKEFLSCRFLWGIMCTFWKRDAVEELGGFNEKYPRLNDPEIHIRAMLKFENSFFVRTNTSADSIYRVDEWKTVKKFSIKYFESLNLFFKDIVKGLRINKKQKYIPYLKRYLVGYYKNSCFWIPLNKNIQLLGLAQKKTIINFVQLVFLTFLILIKWLNFRISNLISSKLNIVVHKLLKTNV